MITIYWSFYLLFSLNEIYHLFNRDRLNLLFEKKSQNQMYKIDVFYYLLRVMSTFWVILGLFSSMWPLMCGLIILFFMQFALYHANYKIYSIYVSIYPIINMIIFAILFFIH
jgi:hypothetical protein